MYDPHVNQEAFQPTRPCFDPGHARKVGFFVGYRWQTSGSVPIAAQAASEVCVFGDIMGIPAT